MSQKGKKDGDSDPGLSVERVLASGMPKWGVIPLCTPCLDDLSEDVEFVVLIINLNKIIPEAATGKCSIKECVLQLD